MRARCTVKRLTLTMRSIFFKDSNLEITFLISSYREKLYYVPSYLSSKNFYLQRHLAVTFRTTNESNIDMYHFIKASHYPTLFGRSWYSARKRLLAR